MRILYTLGIRFYALAIKLASITNKKAAQWVEGRKNWKNKLQNAGDLEGCIWFHCASLGEFEQGRPLLEKLKSQYPQKPILLTFFSPSGYSIRKDYPLADYICYLPIDTPGNARRFMEIVKPDLVIFVKYEVWHNFFEEIARRKTPLLLISSIFRKDQIYFKPYGKWFRKALNRIYEIYTQNEESVDLLKEIGINHASLTGDTRFDRVIEIAENSRDIAELKTFTQGHITIVAGSTWPADEALLAKYASANPEIRWIIAPHEIHKDHINAILEKFPNGIKWSEKEKLNSQNTLVIDSIGLLSTLYKYGNIAYVGGGFGSGIHNTLEPAVYGIPILFGPAFEKFKEASDLESIDAAKPVKSYEDLEKILNTLITQKEIREKMGSNAGHYVSENAGATNKILADIRDLIH